MPELRYPDPPLADDGVGLRPYRRTDLPALVEGLDDPEIPRFTSVPAGYGEREGRAFLDLIEPERLTGRSLTLAIGPDLRGAVGLTRVDWAHRSAEVGYWVAAAWRGQGLATRAVCLLSAWALDQAGLERLELFASPENGASQRVAERAGYTREGLLRSVRMRHGRREDLVLFSRLASDA